MTTCDIEHRPFESSLARAAELGGADLVFTSPPYCDARTAAAYGIAEPWREEHYRTFGDACFAALKPGGHAIVNVDAPVREWRPGFGTERGFHAWRMMFDWAERVGFRVPDRLAFARNGLAGVYSGRFRNDWEPLLWFQRPGDGFFDKSSLDGKAKYCMGGPTSSRRSDGAMQTRNASGDAVENGIRRRGTLWQYGATGRGQSGSVDLEATEHPARFPLRLADDVVRCFSPPGGLVCDPFVGSGTTAVSAAKHGRRFVGGDLGARERDGRRWADIARERAMEILDPAQRSLF